MEATMPNEQILVLGTDGNLWLEQPPYGTQIPPQRTPVDGNVDLLAAFQPIYANEIFVCGSDGNLWLEQGQFGQVPLPDTSSFPPGRGQRYQIDGSVGLFQAMSAGEVFVLGQDGNLWLEFGFGTTIPTVPPPRYQVDGNVMGFVALSLQEVFVLGTDGNLWQELGPFGTVPLPNCNGQNSGCRNQVDGNVRNFFPVDSNNVFVIGTDNRLWLELGPFGQQIPPPRVPVDNNVAAVQPVSAEEVFVLDWDGNLWRENAPFGNSVPLPPCSETSGFGQGFGCRDLIYSRVAAWDYFGDTGEIFVIDFDFNLLEVSQSPPNMIDGNAIAFWPLSSQMMLRRKRHARRLREMPHVGARSAPR
jgi:hypothetical protein